MNTTFPNLLAQSLGIAEHQVAKTIELLEGGATIPFISRYRKEATGSLDEVQIGRIKEGYDRLCELAKRKESIRACLRLSYSCFILRCLSSMSRTFLSSPFWAMAKVQFMQRNSEVKKAFIGKKRVCNGKHTQKIALLRCDWQKKLWREKLNPTTGIGLTQNGHYTAKFVSRVLLAGRLGLILCLH